MVTSVTIPKKGTGYLFDKWKKPKEPLKTDCKYRVFNEFDQKRYDKHYKL